jgi:hypothetical protein
MHHSKLMLRHQHEEDQLGLPWLPEVPVGDPANKHDAH